MKATKANGDNGRAPNGTFAKGWKGGTGNPHAKQTHELREALYSAVKPKDIQAIIAKLVAMAKAGDVVAAKEILDRTIGKANSEPIDMNVIHAFVANAATVNALRHSLLEEPEYLEHLRRNALRANADSGGNGHAGVVCDGGKPGPLANGAAPGNGRPGANGLGNGKH